MAAGDTTARSTLTCQSVTDMAAAGPAAGGKGGFQVNTVGTWPGRSARAHARGVVAGLAYLQYPACLGHGHGLLLQLLHQLVAHRSSRAKKAEVGSTGQRNMI